MAASALRKELGDEELQRLDTGALGLHTYYERLAQGLRQVMAGSRKFAVEHVARDDIAALTCEAAQIRGIRYIMEVDQGKIGRILRS